MTSAKKKSEVGRITLLLKFSLFLQAGRKMGRQAGRQSGRPVSPVSQSVSSPIIHIYTLSWIPANPVFNLILSVYVI